METIIVDFVCFSSGLNCFFEMNLVFLIYYIFYFIRDDHNSHPMSNGHKHQSYLLDRFLNPAI